MPSKGYKESIKTAFWYESDAFEAAYYDNFANKRRFLKTIGKFAEGFWITPTGSALYNARAALRYKDEEAMLYYMNKYFELGGTIKGLERSLDNLHPLAGMNKRDQRAFVAQMTPEDLDRFVKALVFYRQLRTGVEAQYIWEAVKKVQESPKRQRPTIQPLGTLGERATIKPLTKKKARGGK